MNKHLTKIKDQWSKIKPHLAKAWSGLKTFLTGLPTGKRTALIVCLPLTIIGLVWLIGKFVSLIGTTADWKFWLIFWLVVILLSLLTLQERKKAPDKKTGWRWGLIGVGILGVIVKFVPMLFEKSTGIGPSVYWLVGLATTASLAIYFFRKPASGVWDEYSSHLFKAAGCILLAWIVVYAFGQFLFGLSAYDNIQITWWLLMAVAIGSILRSATTEGKKVGIWVMVTACLVACLMLGRVTYIRHWQAEQAHAKIHPPVTARHWVASATPVMALRGPGGKIEYRKMFDQYEMSCPAEFTDYDEQRFIQLKLIFRKDGRTQTVEMSWDKRIDPIWGTWSEGNVQGRWRIRQVSEDEFAGEFGEMNGYGTSNFRVVAVKGNLPPRYW